MLKINECAGELAALNERLAGGDAITARKRIDYLRLTVVSVLCAVVRMAVALQVRPLLCMCGPQWHSPSRQADTLFDGILVMHAESARYIGRASSLQPPNMIQP